MARSRSDANEAGSPSTTPNFKSVWPTMGFKDLNTAEQAFGYGESDEDKVECRFNSQEISLDHHGLKHSNFLATPVKPRRRAKSIALGGSEFLSSRSEEKQDEDNHDEGKVAARIGWAEVIGDPDWQKLTTETPNTTQFTSVTSEMDENQEKNRMFEMDESSRRPLAPEVELGANTARGNLYKRIREVEEYLNSIGSSRQSNADIVTRLLRSDSSHFRGSNTDDVEKSPISAHEDQFLQSKILITLSQHLLGAIAPVMLKHPSGEVHKSTFTGMERKDNNAHSGLVDYLDAQIHYSTSPDYDHAQRLKKSQKYDTLQGGEQYPSHVEDPESKDQKRNTNTSPIDIPERDSSTEANLEPQKLHNTQFNGDNWEEKHKESCELSSTKTIAPGQLDLYLAFSPPHPRLPATSNFEAQNSSYETYGTEYVRRQERKLPFDLYSTDELGGHTKRDEEASLSGKRKEFDCMAPPPSLHALSNSSLKGMPAQSRQNSSVPLKHDTEPAEGENKTHISDDESVLSSELLDSYLRFKAAEKIPRTQVDVAYERGVVEGRKQQGEKTKGLLLLLIIVFAFAGLDIWLSGAILMVLVGIGKFVGLFD